MNELSKAFRHDCHRPRDGSEEWVCPYCYARWEPQGTGGWYCNDVPDVEIISVTISTRDGITRIFEL